MDVATLVKNITTAFEDASTLVQRIRKRKEEEQDALTEPIDDLLDSLSLGPTVVRGYYESDAKRFGATYMTGDAVAREQLKDALISLQMIVLSGLRTVILDDKDPDYELIQSASDDCRVNVGVCLGQLSQRMSKAARGSGGPGKTHTFENVPLRSVQRSNTGSTQSSSGYTKPTPMTPPESDTEYLGDIVRQNSQQRQNFTARAPDLDVMDGMHASSYSGLYMAKDNHNNNAQHHYHRASTGTIPRHLESPVSPQDFVQSPTQRFRDSSISTSSSRSNYPIAYQTQPQQEETSSAPRRDDPPSWGYFGSQSQTQTHNNDYSELTSATLGRVQTPTAASINRKPVSSPITAQPNSTLPTYNRNSIPEEDETAFSSKEVYLAPPIPLRSESRSGSYPIFSPASVGEGLPHYDSLGNGTLSSNHRRTMSSTLGSSVQTNALSNGSALQLTETLRRTSTGPLNLPTEKNLLGFCKGAFRLQAGLEKKAFVVANRPLGYASMLQYWKCDKCNFEGQCSNIIPPGGKKPEKLFDPVIRDYGGIRYKWVFLAKCHVPLKSMVEGRRDGLYGSFCCIFCTAEAAQRGWPMTTNSLPADRTSVKSSNSNRSSISPSMVFGNIHGLMDHLEMHRHPEFWPGVEMQGRMKCIVGRVAPRGEDFDINLLPLQ